MTDEDIAIALIDEVRELIRFRTRHRDNAGKMLAAMYVRDSLRKWFNELCEGPEEPYQQNSSLIAHAEREFLLSPSEDDLDEWLEKGVIDLLHTFSRQGHSGGTAVEMIRLFNHLVQRKPLSPITDKPEDWIDRTQESGYPFWQNSRNSSLFSQDAGKTYFDVNDQPIKYNSLRLLWAEFFNQKLPTFKTYTSQSHAE